MKKLRKIFSIMLAVMLMINLAGIELSAAEISDGGEIENSSGAAKDYDSGQNGKSEEKKDDKDNKNDIDGTSEEGSEEDAAGDQSVKKADDSDETDSEKSTDLQEPKDGEKTKNILENGIEKESEAPVFVSDFKVKVQMDTAVFSWKIEDQNNVITGFDFALYTTADLQEDTKVYSADVKKETEGQDEAELTVDGLKTGVLYYAALTPYSLEETEKKIEAAPTVAEVLTLESPVVSASISEGTVSLRWPAVTGAEYYEVYQMTGSAKTLLATVKGSTSYLHKVAKNNVTYQYAVKAFASGVESGQSNIVSARPRTVAPGKVSGLSGMDGEKSAVLTWSKASNATSYYVYRYNSSRKTWTLIRNTASTSYTDKGLKEGQTYKYRVAAVRTRLGETAVGSATGTVSVSVRKTPGQKVYPMKYKAKIRSKAPCFKSKTSKKRVKYLKRGTKVTTLDSGNGRYLVKLSNGKTYWVAKGRLKITASVWTKKDYSTQTKTNFVNSRGYKSPTKYLIWISQYTQRVMIYEGKKGKWKLIRNCRCATGTHLHKTPKGVFKITYKEKGWFYRTTYEKPIVHFKGANSFHSRIKNYKGGYADPTIGRPKSKGCVRLYDKDINFIYKQCPKGTTVVSY